MTNHSPGPWTFDGPPDNIHVRQLGNPDMRVCFMTSNGPTVANARLIAVAPIMLSVLEAARHVLKDRDQSEAEVKVYNAIRAVIHLATRGDE